LRFYSGRVAEGGGAGLDGVSTLLEILLQQANAALLRLKKQIAKYCPKCPDYKEIRRELIKAGILKPKPF